MLLQQRYINHIHKNETYPVLLEGHMKIIRENPIE